MKNLLPQEWSAQLNKDQNAVILDVRTPVEWRSGVIENAELKNVMNPFKFKKWVLQLDKNKNYYVYCRSGVRSVNACKILERKGIENTFNLVGGIQNWQGKIVNP